MLKPGQYFAAYEWCMTDSFDPVNEDHQQIKVRSLEQSLRARVCVIAIYVCVFEMNHLNGNRQRLKLVMAYQT